MALRRLCLDPSFDITDIDERASHRSDEDPLGGITHEESMATRGQDLDIGLTLFITPCRSMPTEGGDDDLLILIVESNSVMLDGWNADRLILARPDFDVEIDET